MIQYRLTALVAVLQYHGGADAHDLRNCVAGCVAGIMGVLMLTTRLGAAAEQVYAKRASHPLCHSSTNC